MPVFAHDGFGVELHAFHGQCEVAHAHDLAVVSLSGNFQVGGQASALDGQGVMARANQRIGQAAKHTLAAAFKALALMLPREDYVAEQLTPFDPQRIHAVLDAMERQLAHA
jgi:hypothetical protein